MRKEGDEITQRKKLDEALAASGASVWPLRRALERAFHSQYCPKEGSWLLYPHINQLLAGGGLGEHLTVSEVTPGMVVPADSKAIPRC